MGLVGGLILLSVAFIILALALYRKRSSVLSEETPTIPARSVTLDMGTDPAPTPDSPPTMPQDPSAAMRSREPAAESVEVGVSGTPVLSRLRRSVRTMVSQLPVPQEVNFEIL
jgi:hypothetical protein